MSYFHNGVEYILVADHHGDMNWIPRNFAQTDSNAHYIIAANSSTEGAPLLDDEDQMGSSRAGVNPMPGPPKRLLCYARFPCSVAHIGGETWNSLWNLTAWSIPVGNGQTDYAKDWMSRRLHEERQRERNEVVDITVILDGETYKVDRNDEICITTSLNQGRSFLPLQEILEDVIWGARVNPQGQTWGRVDIVVVSNDGGPEVSVHGNSGPITLKPCALDESALRHTTTLRQGSTLLVGLKPRALRNAFVTADESRYTGLSDHRKGSSQTMSILDTYLFNSRWTTSLSPSLATATGGNSTELNVTDELQLETTLQSRLGTYCSETQFKSLVEKFEGICDQSELAELVDSIGHSQDIGPRDTMYRKVMAVSNALKQIESEIS